jgi:hypothetical protein
MNIMRSINRRSRLHAGTVEDQAVVSVRVQVFIEVVQ